MDTGFEGFEAYGKVLRDHSDANSELYRRYEQTAWRIAEVPVTDRELCSMSLHDNTPEAFFPVEGITELAVAARDDFSDCRVFALDQPVIIRPGIWHGLVAVTEQSRVVVVEDAEVHLAKKTYPEGGDIG